MAVEVDTDARYVKYLKMQLVGLPRGAVEHKMRQDGLDPAVLPAQPPSGTDAPRPPLRTLRTRRSVSAKEAAHLEKRALGALEVVRQRSLKRGLDTHLGDLRSAALLGGVSRHLAARSRSRAAALLDGVNLATLEYGGLAAVWEHRAKARLLDAMAKGVAISGRWDHSVRLNQWDWLTVSGVGRLDLELARATVTAGGLGALPALASVNLMSCKGLCDAGVERLAASRTLKAVKLWGCTSITSRAVKALARCRGLAALDLGHCSNVGDGGVAALANCPCLQELHLAYTAVTGEAVEAVARGCPALETLSLSKCGNMTDRGVMALGRACRSLTKLNLTDLSQLSDDGVAALAGIDSLRYLKLTGCTELTDAGVGPLGKCESLLKLDLYQLHRLTDEALKGLAWSRTLKSIDLRNCTGITDVALIHLSAVDSLKSLNLYGATGVTREAQKALPHVSCVGVDFRVGA